MEYQLEVKEVNVVREERMVNKVIKVKKVKEVKKVIKVKLEREVFVDTLEKEESKVIEE